MPLVFDHVTYHYDTEVVGPALDDVSLTVNDGEFVAFIGHTGSGKSTLAEHCNATKLPSSGTVTMDGLGKKLVLGVLGDEAHQAAHLTASLAVGRGETVHRHGAR